MRFRVETGPQEVAERAADELMRVVARKPDAVLAVPTGSTPLPLYRLLASRVQAGTIDLSLVRWFALDEFFAPSLPYECTFRYVLEQELIKPCRLKESNLHSLNPLVPDPELEAARFEAAIASVGGIDLAILGVGTNGHIAFNEPGTPFHARTGLRKLDQGTILSNAHLFPPWVQAPNFGLSMGIATLLEARKVLIIATGDSKADIIARLVQHEPSPDLPASAMKMHPDATLLVDSSAAAACKTGTA